LHSAAAVLGAAGKSGTALENMQKGKPFEEADEEAATNLFFEKPAVPCAWPINAFRLNERLLIQRGVFLVAGDVSKTFEENLAALGTKGADKHIIKFVMRRSVADKAVKDLFAMNICRASLFPGLDGFAQSLAIWHSTYNPPKW
jgi:hypothetical protein